MFGTNNAYRIFEIRTVIMPICPSPLLCTPEVLGGAPPAGVGTRRTAAPGALVAAAEVPAPFVDMLSDGNGARLQRIVSGGTGQVLKKMLLVNAVPATTLSGILLGWLRRRPDVGSFWTAISRALGQTAEQLVSRVNEIQKPKLELIESFLVKALPNVHTVEGGGPNNRLAMATVVALLVIGASWIPPLLSDAGARLLTDTNADLLRDILSRGVGPALETLLLVNPIPDYDFEMILNAFDDNDDARKLVWPRFEGLLEWKTVGPKKDFFVTMWFNFQENVAQTKKDMLSRYTQDAFSQTGGTTDCKRSMLLTALLIGASWKSAAPEKVPPPPRAAVPKRAGSASGRFTAPEANLLTDQNMSRMGKLFKSGADTTIQRMREANAIPDDEIKLILDNLYRNPILRTCWPDFLRLLPADPVMNDICKQRRGQLDDSNESRIRKFVAVAFPETKGESSLAKKNAAKAEIVTALLIGMTQRAPWADNPMIIMEGQTAAPLPPATPMHPAGTSNPAQPLKSSCIVRRPYEYVPYVLYVPHFPSAGDTFIMYRTFLCVVPYKSGAPAPKQIRPDSLCFLSHFVCCCTHAQERERQRFFTWTRRFRVVALWCCGIWRSSEQSAIP